MKQIVFLFLAFIAISAKGQSKVMDANATTRSISADFTAVSVATGVELYLTQGNETSLSVSVSDPKYSDKFKTEVKDGVLKIYYDGKNVSWRNEKGRKLKAYLTIKTLEKLTASSGAVVLLQNTLDVSTFEMRVSSGATFNGDVKTNSLDVDQSSGAVVNISGKAVNLVVETSSGAEFKGYDLTSETCTAKASSGATIKIFINKELDASASSGGDIKYKGNAGVKNLKVSSGGSVKKS
jgi:hypothetical protein